MHKFEITETDGGRRVTARGGTRAGLVIAAVQGLTRALLPPEAASQAESEPVDRPFAHTAETFEALLEALLAEALASAMADGEAYEHARFELITDREAKGGFVGRKAGGFARPADAVRITPGSVRRTEGGAWEAEFTVTGTAR